MTNGEMTFRMTEKRANKLHSFVANQVAQHSVKKHADNFRRRKLIPLNISLTDPYRINGKMRRCSITYSAAFIPRSDMKYVL